LPGVYPRKQELECLQKRMGIDVEAGAASKGPQHLLKSSLVQEHPRKRTAVAGAHKSRASRRVGTRHASPCFLSRADDS